MSKVCGAKAPNSYYGWERCNNPIKAADKACYLHRKVEPAPGGMAFAEKRSETYIVESGQVVIKVEVFADGKVVAMPKTGTTFQFNRGSDPELVKDVANALLAAADLAGKFNG